MGLDTEAASVFRTFGVWLGRWARWADSGDTYRAEAQKAEASGVRVKIVDADGPFHQAPIKVAIAVVKTEIF